MSSRRHLAATIGFVAACLLPLAAQAQIRIGQTAGFTGAVASGVKEVSAGARLYIDAVNAQGGVHGQQVEIVTLDDKFDPALAAANAAKLVADPKVLALFQSWGTPQTEAMIPALKQGRLALVAPASGALVLHQPVNPFIFNVRATYQREAQNAIRYLASVGITRIALLSPTDSFGADASTGATKGFTETKLSPVVEAKYDRAKPELSAAIADIVKREVQAVMFIGSSQVVSEGTAAIRAAGSRAQIVTLSNNASQGFITLMGANARGTVICQVLPNERSVAQPMVKEAVALARAKGLDGVSPATMQGFASAKVLIEGLRRAGKNPTRDSLLVALESLNNFDLGGLSITYGPNDHTGLDYADLAIVDADGKLRR